MKYVSKQLEKHPTSPNTRVLYWKRFEARCHEAVIECCPSMYVHAKHATIIHVSQAYHRYMSRCFMIYTFAANPMFARIGSRISFDMLRSLRRASVFFAFQSPTTKQN